MCKLLLLEASWAGLICRTYQYYYRQCYKSLVGCKQVVKVYKLLNVTTSQS